LEVLVSEAHSKFGAVDLLVNNAGLARPSPYHTRAPENIEDVMRVNLTAPMLLTRMVLPGMLERRCGHIVNMSSLAGKAGPPYEEAYAASKAGLIGFTKSLRLEYRDTGVGASVVCPGFVAKAGMFERWRDGTGLAVPWLLGSVTPEAVASAVVRAIKENTPEIMVSAAPAKVFTTLAELSPSLGEWMVRRSGAVDLFRKAAERMEAAVGPSQRDP
jgi:short-subunit dehydrogenase